MTILAFEFSSPQRSVAIARSETVLAQAVETGGRHTATFAMIERVLAQAKIQREEIEGIAVGSGPGSYTGIRAAISIAQGWQLATGVKTAGASSVAAIAAQAQMEKIFGRVNVVVDAQRNEIYLATYEISEQKIAEIEPLKIVSPGKLLQERDGAAISIGPEVQRWSPSGKIIFPVAAMLAKSAAMKNDFISADKLEPIYLREAGFVKAPPSRIIA
ncbi:MAG TPA: tRNA (adenosine(37)-N6)-threonylcarbamoyltransferase complex dimerization subunit type 1 TsaB [Verrucomicrobiae bacterium]|nr:tRNA (adenosine(37)-N6)-threonylcarbamoyltransferase complex dimerization subunit type 1 TsaB [Verrucomicrobiae bacterium]